MNSAALRRIVTTASALGSRLVMTVVVLTLFQGSVLAESIAPAIGYQGELSFQGQPADGPFDFEFRVFDVDTGGSEIANTVALEDVSVSDGVFSVELDFGLTPYAGDQLWIEVSVREGSDPGGFQALLPRQKVNPAPYALHAEMVAMDAISGAEIADNSISSSELADDSVAGSEVVDGSLTAADLAAGAVNGLTIQDGSVSADDLGIGSVGSDEILDGAIGAVDLAVNSVGAEAVAPDSIGLSEIVPGEVQARVIGTCSNGTYLSGINEDGSAICRNLPVGLEHTVRTTTQWSSVTIRSDGRPLVATSDLDLHVYDCLNAVCSSGILRVLINTGGSLAYPSIAMSSNGTPIISYKQAGNLKLYECTEVDCSAGVVRTLDGSVNTGDFNDMAIRQSGLPIISYYDRNAGDLKVFDCADATCSTGIQRTLDNAGNVGEWSSIAIRGSGLPIISYLDRDNGNLLVFRCDDPGCSNGSRRTVDDSGTVGESPSIAVRQSAFRQPGLPIISYYDQPNDRLRIYRCDDVDCDTGTTRLGPSSGRYSKIAIRLNGLPMVSYLDFGTDLVGFRDCLDVNCQALMPRPISPSNGYITMGLAVRRDGLPFMSYPSQIGFLNVYSCGDTSCQN